MSFGGGGGGAAMTQQQQDLQTEQGVTQANLNLEENEQRKTMLNALQGTRVFRGSALSRQMQGNAPATGAPAAPSSNQQAPPVPAPVAAPGSSLMDLNGTPGSAGPAGAVASTGGLLPGAQGLGAGRVPPGNPNPNGASG